MDHAKHEDWDDQARIELVLGMLAGETTAERAAEQHGLDAAELQRWKSLYVSGLRHAQRSGKESMLRRLRRTAKRHPLAVPAGAVASLLVLLVPVTALSQTPADCLDPLSLGLCQFHAGEPAVAAQVNANFEKLRYWLERKVGEPVIDTNDPDASMDITTGDVTADNVTATGALEAENLSALGGELTINGPTTINGSVSMMGGYELISDDADASGVVTAETDGFVVALGIGGPNCYVQVAVTDRPRTDTTFFVHGGANGEWSGSTVTLPVPEGAEFSVAFFGCSGDGTTRTVRWMPLGHPTSS